MRSKKMFAIILCLIMVLLAAGCSQQENDETNIPKIPTELNVSDHETTATTLPSTEESTVSNGLIYYIWDTRSFSDGVAWVETCNKEDDVIVDSQWACIDTNGNILFMLAPNTFTPDDFENGVALYETFDEEYNVDAYNVIDKSGNVIFSSQDGLFDGVIAHDNGYFAVYDHVEGFDAAGYNLLFLNNKGNVTLETEQLFEEIPELINCGEGVFALKIRQNAAAEVTYRFYDAQSGSQYEIGEIGYHTDISYIFHDGYAIIEGPRMGDIPKLVSTDGTITPLDCFGYGSFYDFGPVSDGGFVCTSYYQDKVECVWYCDIEAGSVTQLGNYGERVKLSRAEGFYFDNGHLLLPLVGADGKNYYTIIDKSGQSLFDPIACESAYAEGEDRIVVKYEDKTVVYNGKGDTVFELPAGQSIDSYQSGMARLVGEDHSIQDIYIDLEGNVLFDNDVLFTAEG